MMRKRRKRLLWLSLRRSGKPHLCCLWNSLTLGRTLGKKVIMEDDMVNSPIAGAEVRRMTRG